MWKYLRMGVIGCLSPLFINEENEAKRLESQALQVDTRCSASKLGSMRSRDPSWHSVFWSGVLLSLFLPLHFV